MENVKDVYFSPLNDSTYVRPFRFNYTQDGRHKTWDLLEVHDSVAILVFNVTRRKVIFVKQFRPAVYFNSIKPEDREADKIDTDKYPASLGITLEMCAGIVDKNLSLEEIACEEVLEECGYKVQLKDLQRVLSYRSGVGVQGAEQTLYYVEVTDDMKSSTDGGGVDDEIIEVVEMSIPEVEKFLLETPPSAQPLASPPSCLFALMWFLRYKADKYRKSFERHCGSCKLDAEAARRADTVPVGTEQDLRLGPRNPRGGEDDGEEGPITGLRGAGTPF
ncbi:uridine diphosphate glucose pyrophosphatase [Phthorimaea operculella]|nr:uridine diphosphate glucose pyrophosphatase [Phthorimaea operculella]